MRQSKRLTAVQIANQAITENVQGSLYRILAIDSFSKVLTRLSPRTEEKFLSMMMVM